MNRMPGFPATGVSLFFADQTFATFENSNDLIGRVDRQHKAVLTPDAAGR